MKILITESRSLICDGDVSLFEFENLGSVTVYENITREELLKEITDTDAVLCNKAEIDREVIEKAEHLKYIGIFATGYNNIDTAFAKEKGIPVCNAAGYSTNAVVQQVMGYILIHFTKISEYDRFVKADGWKNSDIFSPIMFSSEEVYGKTLGIVGYGNIGKAVANAALGLGLKVKVYTRTPKIDDRVEFVTFDELLKESDIVTLHCPLTEQTKDIMNNESFKKMKDGAFFINTSRGGTVDEDALYEALKSGKLSGAGIDVLKKEPMSKSCRLAEAPNIILTPHSAWSPFETRKRLVSLAADNLKAFLSGHPKNIVN